MMNLRLNNIFINYILVIFHMTPVKLTLTMSYNIIIYDGIVPSGIVLIKIILSIGVFFYENNNLLF